MKININFTNTEANECIDLIREIGADNSDIMDMINDFKIGGANLKMVYTSCHKNLYIEINDKIVVKIISKIKPMVSMVKCIFHTVAKFFDDVEEYFEDVKCTDSWSRRNSENNDALIKRLTEENEMLSKKLKMLKLESIEDTDTLSTFTTRKAATSEDFVKDYEHILLSHDEISEEEYEASIEEMERHDSELIDEEAMAALKKEEEECFRSIEGK